jgi:hypothetical protein
MTRDEAIKLANVAWEWDFEKRKEMAPAVLVDMLAGLGVLRLEEPKKADEKAFEALKGKNLPRGNYDVYVLGPNEVGAIIDTLHTAGLKIVEK